MSVQWENAEFIPVESALAVDIDGVACTMIVKEEGYTICWSLGIKGQDLTLPEVDGVVAGIARVIRIYLRETMNVDFEPDDGT